MKTKNTSVLAKKSKELSINQRKAAWTEYLSKGKVYTGANSFEEFLKQR